MTPRLALALLLGVLATSRCLCVLPQGGLGQACTESKDCNIGLVCVLMNEDEPDSAPVCMPPLSFDRTACQDYVECTTAGMPTDSFCTPEGNCACDDLMDNVQLSCNSGFTPGRFACFCVELYDTSNGESCDHPEECASGVCVGGACADRCNTSDDCGTPFTNCDSGECS